VRPDAPEREPLHGTPPPQAPASPPGDFERSERAIQWVLFIVVAVCLVTGVCTWLLNEHVYAVLAFLVAVIAGIVLIIGAQNKRGKGPGTVKLPLIGRRTDHTPATPGPAQQAAWAAPAALEGGGAPAQYPPAAPQYPPGPPYPAETQYPAQTQYPPETQYPAGGQGHPFGAPKGQHRSDGRSHTQPGQAVAAAPAWNAAPLPEPPVFAGRSTPGQAPWHLPVGATPSGLAADGVRLGDLEVRAASVVGSGHRCQEPAVARQDAYALGRTADGEHLVVAIADGVSQSEHADLAARVAVNAAVRELTELVEKAGSLAIDATELYLKVAGEMIGTGRARGIQDREVCAILITAVIPARPEPDGTRSLWASWIGDVSLWISRDGRLHRTTGQDKDGLDRNALHAVLPFNPDQVQQCRFPLYPDDRVVLLTDGVSDSLTSIDAAMEYFTRQWAGPPPHPAAFLHSLCYDGPSETDDRTAVVVWCGSSHPGNRWAADERR
jgi:serine/threonine protein phosphatase PrpC